MIFKDSLFTLIKSMTKSEKRYFKLSNSLIKKNNYIKLFDAIDKQIEYDEKAIIKKFRNEKFVNHLAVIKNQLQEKILNALNEHHQDKNIHALILGKMTDASTLYNRGLYDLGYKYLEKAKEMIMEHECYEFMAIYERKRATFAQKENYQTITHNEIKAIEHETIDKLEALIGEMKIMSCMQRFTKVLKQYGFVQNEIASSLYHEIINEPIMQDVSKLHTDKARYNFYYIKSVYHFAFRNKKECIDNSLAALEILRIKAEKNPLYINPYIGSLSNAISNCISFRQYKFYRTFKAQLEKVEMLIDLSRPQGEQTMMDIIRLAELKYTTLSGAPNTKNSVNNLLKKIEVDETFNSLIVNETLYFSAYAYLIINQYNNCLVYLDKLDKKTNRENNSLYSNSTILRIICHFEKKDFEYLPSLLRNAKRALDKYSLYSENEILFFQFIKKLIRFQNDKNKLNQTKTDFLEKLNTDTSLSSWNNRIFYNFENWLTTKI